MSSFLEEKKSLHAKYSFSRKDALELAQDQSFNIFT